MASGLSGDQTKYNVYKSYDVIPNNFGVYARKSTRESMRRVDALSFIRMSDREKPGEVQQG